MSLIPMLYSDWWEDLERPHSVLDQHFGLPVDPEEIAHRSNAALNRYHAEQQLGYPFFRRMRKRHHPFHHALMRRTGGPEKIGSPHCRTDRDRFLISLDVKQFMIDELTVKTIEKQGLVVVEARHEEKEDEHGWITRQFTRKYNVPSSIYDIEQIESCLSSDGILTVTAPRKKSSGDMNERIIKIQYTGEPAIVEHRPTKSTVEQSPPEEYGRDHLQQRSAHMSQQQRGKKINVKGV